MSNSEAGVERPARVICMQREAREIQDDAAVGLLTG